MEKIEELLENCLREDETVLLADGFEDAFIGIGRQFGRPVAIYDRSQCISILEHHMEKEKVEEYFSSNIENSYIGKFMPVFLEAKM